MKAEIRVSVFLPRFAYSVSMKMEKVEDQGTRWRGARNMESKRPLSVAIFFTVRVRSTTAVYVFRHLTIHGGRGMVPQWSLVLSGGGGGGRKYPVISGPWFFVGEGYPNQACSRGEGVPQSRLCQGG